MEYYNLLNFDLDWEEFPKKESNRCECVVPKVQDLSLFRPYFVCNSCDKEIEPERVTHKRD